MSFSNFSSKATFLRFLELFDLLDNLIDDYFFVDLGVISSTLAFFRAFLYLISCFLLSLGSMGVGFLDGAYALCSVGVSHGVIANSRSNLYVQN